MIPADKKAIPSTYWFINGKYYESTTAFAPTGISNQIHLNEVPNLERELTDPYVIDRIKAAFLKDKNHA